MRKKKKGKERMNWISFRVVETVNGIFYNAFKKFDRKFFNRIEKFGALPVDNGRSFFSVGMFFEQAGMEVNSK